MITNPSLFIIVALLSLPCLSAFSQDQRIRFIKLEAGVEGIFTEVPKHSYIRGETMYNSGSWGELTSTGTAKFLGAAFEIKSRSGKFSYSSGLRYRRMDTELSKNPMETTGNYFYFKYNQTETSVDFLRVNKISQASDYLGITADVRWFPFNRHRFNFYFRGGLEMDCLVDAKAKVNFENSTMNQFGDEAAHRVKDPSSVSGILHLIAGVEIGKESKFPVRIESGPTIFLTDNSPGLVRTIAGFEVMASFQIPF